MKGIVMIIIFAILVLTGCSFPNADTVTSLSEDKQNQSQPVVVELVTINGEYRTVWKENYEYDTPLKIESYSDWVRFFKEHPESSATENVINQDFTVTFFEDNLIYAYVKSEPSGSIMLFAKTVRLENNILTLYMERIVPEVCTDDMATRICLFGINREKIKDVRKVNVLIAEELQFSSNSKLIYEIDKNINLKRVLIPEKRTTKMNTSWAGYNYRTVFMRLAKITI